MTKALSLFLIALLLVPILQISSDSSVPWLNKTLIYEGEIRLNGFSGEITLGVIISDVAIENASVRGYYECNYTISGAFENGTEYSLSGSTTGTSEGMIRIKLAFEELNAEINPVIAKIFRQNLSHFLHLLP